ncbi:DNA-binding response regulator, NarL/FixJ family [Lentimicrobium saccharophilum]|uniref:DNA-binding response regulator, NarL/FixJ family n=1 Tax=Lentimicrobium saccharophilum TaxID=1678841 RepID=A0A0S7C0H3_9BACT|nr:response regulator transcription factor [Lentimicrobium saccharophilum]GAP43473.1 DNA-binding response regulator, NarL/FixJ family [Lentimicrobium saccharophilum]
MDRIKVVIVDDHKMVVEGLRKLIDESQVALVSDVAYSAQEAISVIVRCEPHVVLLDINLPDASGLDLCRQLKSTFPDVKIVALTSYSDYSVVKRMLANGASGYVIKNAMPDEIILSIETVYKNQQFLCEEIDVMLHRRGEPQVWLTNRETELLRYIVDGFTNPEIADRMFLGLETINSYRKNLLCKLGARNTAMLVKIAMERMLV